MKLKYILEGVQENKELYELADLILKELSKTPIDRLFDVTVRTSKFNNEDFKYANIITNRDIEVEIAGDKSYYSGLYKLIRLSENEFRQNYTDDLFLTLKTCYRHILVHELQHAYDDIRSKGNYNQDKQSQEYYNSQYKSHYSYLKLPHEVWARFAELAEHITPYIRRSNLVSIVEDYLRGWEYLDEQMKRRILKAVYKLYDLKVQEFRNKNK